MNQYQAEGLRCPAFYVGCCVVKHLNNRLPYTRCLGFLENCEIPGEQYVKQVASLQRDCLKNYIHRIEEKIVFLNE